MSIWIYSEVVVNIDDTTVKWSLILMMIWRRVVNIDDGTVKRSLILMMIWRRRSPSQERAVASRLSLV